MRSPGLLLIAVLASGCSQLLGIEDLSGGGDDVVTPDADPGPDADPTQSAAIAATWSIVDGYTADVDNAGVCPPDATHARLHAEGPGGPVVDAFDCATGTGTMPGLDLGDHEVWIELTSSDGTVIYAQSERTTVDLQVAGTTEPVDFAVDGYNGFLRLSWSVVASSCGATEVISALYTIQATAMGAEDIRLCTAGEDPTTTLSMALPVGTILLSTSLLNASQQSIGSAPVASRTIDHGGQIVDLGPLQITRD